MITFQLQENIVTSWLDSSNVYGSTIAKNNELKTLTDGLLKSEKCKDGTECLIDNKANDTTVNPSFLAGNCLQL
jgi:hypothetical protein